MNPIVRTDNHRKPAVTTLLLQKYYTNVQDLRSYLLEILDTPSIDTVKDDEAFRSYISDTVVASRAVGCRRFTVQAVNYVMGEVVARAQCQLLRENARSVLTIGYLMGHSEGDLVMKDKNTIVSVFDSPEWTTLLSKIGVDAMLHLLTETSIFIPLPNGCLCQVTGEPLLFLRPLAKDASVDGETRPACTKAVKRKYQGDLGTSARPHKRRRLNKPPVTPKSHLEVVQSTPADIMFARARLFYARPCFIPRTNHFVVGLPVNHVLNRIHPSYSRERRDPHTPYQEPDHRKQAENVRHLSKYIFPGQYGLQTPFQSFSGKKDAFPYPDYLDRESEIEILGSCKTPKRLKGTMAMVDQILWRHEKCSYKALRDLACPSKIPTEGDGDIVHSSIILELVSESSMQLATQPSLRLSDVSLDSSGQSIRPIGGTQASAHTRNKPRFIEFACTHTEVFRYVALVTTAVIPMSFWGDRANFKRVMKVVKRFITCRRYETFSLHFALQNFSTTACEWLAPPGEKAQAQKRVSVSDSLKRRELLEEFLFWYLDGFVTPLLKTTFYITESSAFRNQILYFRQDDWKILCEPLLDRLIHGMFERIPDKHAKEILRQRSLGFSFVRLLPKETGVRPIVNLRKKKPITTGNYTADRSINQVLQTAFNILSYEKNIWTERLGASVFGSDEVYAKLSAFKKRVSKSENGSLPKLYFVKVDVQACFDSIEQTKLLEILRELISKDTYVTQRHGQLHFSANRIKRTFVRRAFPSGHDTHFVKTAQDLSRTLRNIIFVDQVRYPEETKDNILELLEEHITDNTVKIGKHYYKQKVGIPQGSVLSALLCSFFYGDLERRTMRFTEDIESVLMRLIDDYLFITTSLKKAKAFLEMMNNGHPEYGCFISKDKTLTNFDYGTDVMNVVDPSSSKNFAWCGYLINMRDLSVTVDYSRYAGWGIKNTLTVVRGRQSGAVFKHKMLLFGQARNHIIYSAPDLNPEDTVYLNFYQNFLLTALKMHEYIRDGGLSLKQNSTFIYKTIQETIEYSHASAMAQASRKNIGGEKRWRLKRLAVLW
ncbi:hypothetical protein CC2G_007253 [Coprinopsis cinerea AmutBmut pab1-1]|nr:hypothetical protein CC2G_007253 [Coprinopsis cinerea AmutBmut pab1-1]